VYFKSLGSTVIVSFKVFPETGFIVLTISGCSILIVIDSVGIGTCKDSYKFNDEGANTIGHIAESDVNGIKLPTMEKMGYGKIAPIKGVRDDINVKGLYGKLQELSNGKDTMTGHWEMMGIKTEKPFITFTDTGFPDELIKVLEEKWGRKIVGNKSASGTAIIDELGKVQEETGALIVYTSADSVLQIAANENIIPLEELYRDCEIAREVTLKDDWKVGRIIARPYIKLENGSYKRTTNRHDYALDPTDRTVLNELYDNNYKVISVGKISDIFNKSGITEGNHIDSNHDGMLKTMNIIKNDNFTGLCFVNLVDFDALFGHRRDVKGYYNSMVEFDKDLGDLINLLNDDDLLMVTADHGNDPTWVGTDHTREYVPLLVYNKLLNNEVHLDVQDTFSCIGATIAENFNVKTPKIGKSFLNKI